jgi:hypothetical protein
MMKKFLAALNAFAVITLVAMFAWFLWPRDPPVPGPVPSAAPSGEAPVMPKGPEKVVHDVFRKLGDGSFKHTDVFFDMKFDPMRGLPVTLDPRGGPHEFHGVVKFPLTDVKIDPFDPKTKTVNYSVRVPHPCVMFWQWDAVYPDELTWIPKGLLMKGSYKLTELTDGSWGMVVDDTTNPVALYQMVYHSVNRIWYSGKTNNGFSSELLKFVMLMHFSAYQLALEIPKGRAHTLAQQWMDECERVIPKENAK